MITLRTKYQGDNIIGRAQVTISKNGGGLNITADDGTTLITGDTKGITVQDADGTRRTRLGVQPDGTRETINVTTKPGVDLDVA